MTPQPGINVEETWIVWIVVGDDIPRVNKPEVDARTERRVVVTLRCQPDGSAIIFVDNDRAAVGRRTIT